MKKPTDKHFLQFNKLQIILAIFFVCLLTYLVYMPGLNGPFLFDDIVHITQNKQVHITDISLASLNQAWDSSLSPKPWHRPLAQLSFGINHAFSGLSPFAFKTTNLAIHIINGLLIFLLSRTLLSAHIENHPKNTAKQRIVLFSLAVCIVWLIHPLNVSPVLYVVQRMTELSTLFVLLALWIYSVGRLSMVKGNRGIFLILISFPIAGIGLLAKENAILFPLFLLVFELTIFRTLISHQSQRSINLIRLFGIFIPLSIGLIYLITHPNLYMYDTRSFTLEERVLTQFRVLWYYCQLFFTPSLETLGFYHDDFVTSENLTTPLSTLFALISWIGIAIASLVLSKRMPIISFGLLFFLAAHILESSILPLEMIFEHRNYLAIFGLSFVLCYLLLIEFSDKPIQGLLNILFIILCIGFASLTYLRASNWSSMPQLTLSEVEHHPNSPRANFKAAQLYIGIISKTQNKSAAYNAARQHLEAVLKNDPHQPNSLFGLIVLNLYVNKQPEPAWIDELEHELQYGNIGPTRLSVSQFSFLVRWHIGNNYPLNKDIMPRLFDAALKNKGLNNLGRASILAARRAYHNQVLKQPETALPYARQSAKLWPKRWHYQKRYAQIAATLLQFDEATSVVLKAIKSGLPDNHLQEAKNLLSAIKQQRAKMKANKQDKDTSTL